MQSTATAVYTLKYSVKNVMKQADIFYPYHQHLDQEFQTFL